MVQVGSGNLPVQSVLARSCVVNVAVFSLLEEGAFPRERDDHAELIIIPALGSFLLQKPIKIGRDGTLEGREELLENVY